MSETNKRQISPVNTREEKRMTYRAMLQRYKTAIAHEFYLEAILIDYACLEDRLRYLLYYIGVIRSESDYKITGAQSTRMKTYRNILRKYTVSDANMTISSISGKRNIVKSVFLMLLDENQRNDSSDITRVLRKQMSEPDRAKQILELLDRIENWCKYRNEVIHSLMNKNLDSLYQCLSEKAQEGHELFRELDKHVSWVKRKNIRIRIGIE